MTEVGEFTPLGIKWRTLHSRVTKITAAQHKLLLDMASLAEKNNRADSDIAKSEQAELKKLIDEDTWP